jgi:hypothetical protein
MVTPTLPIVHAGQSDSSLSSDNRTEPTQGKGRQQGRNWQISKSLFAVHFHRLHFEEHPIDPGHYHFRPL